MPHGMFVNVPLVVVVLRTAYHGTLPYIQRGAFEVARPNGVGNFPSPKEWN